MREIIKKKAEQHLPDYDPGTHLTMKYGVKME